MNTRLLQLACVLTLLGGAAFAGKVPVVGEANRIDDRIVVRLIPSADQGAQVQAFIDAMAMDYPEVTLTQIDAIPEWDMVLFDANGATAGIADAIEVDLLAMNHASIVVWAEFLYDNEAPEGQTTGGTGSTFVDSPIAGLHFQSQYSAGMTGLPAAHATSQGQQVVVAVLDTGIDGGHPLLAPRTLNYGYDFVDDDADPQDVGDGLDTDGDMAIDEMTGHGTFVAGLIALVAPEAKILPVRILDADGVGNGWLIAKGIHHAVQTNAHVINLSLRSTYRSAPAEDAVEIAKNAGIICVAAAANFDREDPREYPAMGSNVLGVAATDHNDIKASFSNYNDRIFMSAPGASVVNMDGTPDFSASLVSAIPGGGYGVWEGTSMATPLVAGTIALIRAQHPEWIADECVFTLVGDVLEQSALDIDGLNPAFASMLGAGRLRADVAVAAGPPAPTRCQIADVTESGAVNIDDLVFIINNWGPCFGCRADVLLNGVVNIDDLLEIVNNFGNCE